MDAFKKRTNRTAEPTSLKEAMQDLFKQYQLDGKLREKRLLQSWARIMGNTIAKRTSKVFIKDKILFVYLSSASLRNEMTMSKSKVMDLIEQESGKGVIEDILFK